MTYGKIIIFVLELVVFKQTIYYVPTYRSIAITGNF